MSAALLMDISNYDWPFTVQTAQCLGAHGFRLFIVGSQRPDIARAQIAAIHDAGLRIQGTYAFLYHGRDTLGQTRNAIDLARLARASYVWLDCEATPPHESPTMTPGARVIEIRQCVREVEAAGLRPGIYTGGWWWPTRTHNSTEFSHLPLWHSEYPADEREIRAVAYGGWTGVAIHQFSSTLSLCGRERDRNYVFDETLLEDHAMTDDDLLAVFAGGEEREEDPDNPGQTRLVSREERLRRARWRRDEAAAGRAPSIRELALRHAAGMAVPDHQHAPGGVIR